MKQRLFCLTTLFLSAIFGLFSCGGNRPDYVDTAFRIEDSIYTAHLEAIDTLHQKIRLITENCAGFNQPLVLVSDADTFYQLSPDSAFFKLEKLVQGEFYIIHNNHNMQGFGWSDTSGAIDNFSIREFSDAGTEYDKRMYITEFWHVYNHNFDAPVYPDSINAEEKKEVISKTETEITQIRSVKYILLVNDVYQLSPDKLDGDYFAGGMLATHTFLYDLQTGECLGKSTLIAENGDEIGTIDDGDFLSDSLQRKTDQNKLIDDLVNQRNKLILDFYSITDF